MSKQEAVDHILEESDLEKEELKEKVEEKMEEFSGLVSEEGAVHLVAKEEGIDLAESSKQDIKTKNIVPEMRNLKVKGRIVSILEPNTFTRDDGDEGKVQNIVLGDDTGTIRITLWDEQTEIAEKVEEGDAIEITRAYTVEDDRENAEIRLGDDSQVKMADDDEVPELESQDMDEASLVEIQEVRSENNNYTIRGMLMEVYTSNPFYRTDPETGDTVREDEDGNYVTSDGEEVEDPDNALAVSAVLDDGTDNLRVVLFRDQARKVLEVDEETEKEGDLRKVEDAAEEAIGKELEITGRTRYNDYFGALELMVNDVEEVDAKEQIEDLMEIMEA